MDAFAVFRNRVEEKLINLYPELSDNKAALSRFVVEPPRDASHGDLSCNAAMVLSKTLKSNPRAIADSIVAAFEGDPQVANIEIAGPGFINFTLTPDVWQSVIADANEQGADYGRPAVAPVGKVNVEYVSANPTGPLHVGHTRGAVFGDALASLMAFCRYEITREYYINDAGGQITVLANSAYLRYCQALGDDIGEIPAGLYPGKYLIPVGKALAEQFGDKLKSMDDAEREATIRPVVLEKMMDMVRADLEKLGIKHDKFFSESTLHGGGNGGDIKETLDWLREQGLVYQGTLEAPKGKTPEEWEDREQTLFKATQFGDDTDRALVKSDGSYTYFAADIAYHRNKYLRGYNSQIVVLGADHAGYIKRLGAAGKAVSGGEAEVDVKICQLVNLLRNGQPAKMSKRSGNFVTMANLVEEVGQDVVRFIMLFRRNEAPLDFDFDLVTQQTRDNPVFYVQYAHARACSAFRNAARDVPELDVSPDSLKSADLSLLSHPAELTLLKVMGQFPRAIEAAAVAHEPHRVAFYVHELAGAFNAFWTKGKEEPQLRFVNHEDRTITLARLAMVNAVRQILRNGLGILGVSAPDELS
ncbi:arginine--tRNA ligase [Maritalea porphyrae]|jgi:arginyl-tRNA synthetase|uniref:arginine--tRNA ligase n=1 Tax=Maritalea porphyrae TaxID=880732 RepID=UPI0022AFE1CC|nr:arginine--tRNA ligase [Maritalea porphyrae]MCZ4273161.1 arginine--tRNA ligase [Maritalea porphyrae]